MITPPIPAVLLAAGASTRMGQPKQLLPYQGRTLLRRAAETALAAGCAPVIIVTGALHQELAVEVADLPVQLVHNAVWEAGLGTSIGVGVQAVEDAAPEAPAVLVLLTDQPLVTAELLRQLLREWQLSGLPVATGYADSVGVPAVFGRLVWPQLLALPAAAGAKLLLQRLGDELVVVPFPAAALDVDTPEQYQALLDQPSPEPV
ncbi:nucleotidyltransferase family protein [Hymenobacter sp. 15J16-1T3B]|uniref:nucleotidyltransferase family protein n=1 Tax=Hymenobacter sp. 15J16-1T3B TaxID=2886941 RepID=UPI001D10DE1E|nr:nucleotidyltransferase family protein [Hymenobacter sp. 15J16-1T3B]MCC3159270.1 nucleotidyltransferase family protein [Hymenobacter sp. 15J16-1T3B]